MNSPIKASLVMASETHKCATHGDYQSIFLIGRWSDCPKCADIMIAEKERSREAQVIAERRAKYEAKAQIPEKLAQCGLKNYEVEHSRQANALNHCREYLKRLQDNIKTARNMIFYGCTGNGKSHLAAAILRTMAHSLHRCRYVTSSTLIDDICASWTDKTAMSERQAINHYAGYELLVIDELGQNDDRPKGKTFLAAVIDARYLNNLPTILITNLSETDIPKALGDRAYDRISENSQFLRFDWESYRQKNVRRD